MRELNLLIERHAAPRRGDDMLTLIHRAERGARIVGAIAVCAAAEAVDEHSAAAVLNWLRHSRMSSWGNASRTALAALRRAGHPLAGWADIECHGRRVDQWLNDYEISLRHSGRFPPPGCAGSLRAALHRELGALCDAVLRATPRSSIVDGTGRLTTLRCRDHEHPIAPFLQTTPDELWLWDGELARPRGGEWIALRDRGVGGDDEPGPVGPRRDGSRSWRAIGAAAVLERRACRQSSAAFRGTQESGATISFGGRLPVYVLERGDPERAAEEFAARVRSVRQAVVVALGVLADDEPAPVLENLLAGGEGDHLAVLRELGSAGQPPLVILAGYEVHAGVAGRFWEYLAGLAIPVVFTRANVFDCRWSPAARRRAERLALAARAERGRPESVQARLDAGSAEGEAWRDAAIDVFGLTDAGAVQRFVDVMTGRVDLLERPEGLAWWDQGAVTIAPDGVPAFVDPGWADLLAGLRGEGTGPASAARDAGRSLRWMLET